MVTPLVLGTSLREICKRNLHKAGLAIIILLSIPSLLILGIVRDIQSDDLVCTKEYGANWDHQKREEETIRTVCINIETKEEKPVPK